jgi:collagen type XIV alpha
VLDSSGSLTENGRDDWNTLKRFLYQLIERINVGTNAVRIGAVKFSREGNLEFQLDRYQDRQSLRNAIEAMVYIGDRTNIADGLQIVREQVFSGNPGDRPGVPNVVIVITDGKANERITETGTEAELTQREARVIAVGVTEDVDERELNEIATTPNDVIRTADFESLIADLDRILAVACPTEPIPPPVPVPPPVGKDSPLWI